jgi:hypothetical protein
MPSNGAQLPDTHVAVARRSHTCFYTVWCAHYYFTHPEVVAVFWQKPNAYIVKEFCMVSFGDESHGFLHGIRVAIFIELTLSSFCFWGPVSLILLRLS